MLQKTDQPLVTDRVKEATVIGVQNPAHFPSLDADHKRVQSIMLAAPRPKSIRKSEKIFLVDRIQHRDHRSLEKLILQRRDTQRPLSPIGFRNIPTPTGQCAVRAPMNPSMEVSKIALQFLLVVLPCHSIHSGSSPALERVERQPQQINADVVEQRSEPFLLPRPCCLTYALQRL